MITVEKAKPEDFLPGVEFYYHACSAEERSLKIQELYLAHQRGDISLDNLLIAKWEDDLVGVLLYHRQADESAFLWPPVVHASHSHQQIADSLLQVAFRQIEQTEADFIQVLLEPDQLGTQETLERNGFQFLSNLKYLQRELSESLPEIEPSQLEEFHFDEKTNRDRFVQLLEQTYLETLDCPGFTSVLDGQTALRSHQLSGQFTPQKWKLFCLQGKDIGLLLMNEHPDQSAWEIVYMGVVPNSRGYGFGRQILLSALHDAASSPHDFVLLAVDCNNKFAMNIYRELGFRELADRRVLIYKF